mgnify:FL=1|jgi:hypothetical protein
MRLRRISLIGLVVSVIVLMFADVHRQVLAIDTPVGSGGADGGSIWAGIQTSSPPNGSGSDSSGYRWVPATIYDSGIGATTGITKLVGSIRYDLYERHAPNGAMTLVWIPRPSITQLAQNAAILVRGRLPQPSVMTAPPTNQVVVNVGMWMWADTDWWYPVSAMAWVPTVFGSAWARTTATPVRLRFITQDDGTVSGGQTGSMECAGPGREWSVPLGDEAVSPCMYTYEHSSVSRDGGVFVGVVSVDWEISWTSNTGGRGGLPSYTTNSFMAVRVDELQALVE